MCASARAAGSIDTMEFQGEAADGLWQHCKNVMQALRITAREKSFFDPGVSAARIQLRAAYEAFLLQEHSGAQVRAWLAFRFH